MWYESTGNSGHETVSRRVNLMGVVLTGCRLRMGGGGGPEGQREGGREGGREVTKAHDQRFRSQPGWAGTFN